MAIKIEDLDLSEGEEELYGQKVLLEKADSPGYLTKEVPDGYLILTSKKLLFLSKVREEQVKKFFTIRTQTYPDREFIKIQKRIDIEKYLNSEYSFAVPLERVVAVEKTQSDSYPMKFIRIGIMQEDGLKINYCIHPTDMAWNVIDLDEWLAWFNHAKGVKPYTPTKKKMSLSEKILYGFVFGIISFVFILGAMATPDLEWLVPMSLITSFFVAVFIYFQWLSKYGYRGMIVLFIVLLAITDGLILNEGVFDVFSLAIFPAAISILVIILFKLIGKRVTSATS